MRYLLLLLCLLALPAAAAPDRYLDSIQTASAGTDPSSASDGMSLLAAGGSPIRHFWVNLCAASGQTLSGAGTLRAWVYNSRRALWMRNPDLDLAVGSAVAGKRCRAWVDLQVGVKSDRRLHFVSDGVTVSSGDVTITVEGYASL
jgi:hypothetical protein